MLIARFVLSGHGTHCRDSQPENAFSPASTRNRKKLQNRLFVLNVFNFMLTLDYTQCSQSADKRYVYRSPQAKLEKRRLCDEVCVRACSGSLCTSNLLGIQETRAYYRRT